MSAGNNPAASSSFWIDDNLNVWRDSTKLGILRDNVEYWFLSSLIEHKGQVLTTGNLRRILFDTSSPKLIVQGFEFVGEVFKGGQGEGYTAEE